jgi:dUTP pyrophosphatase
MNRLLTAKDIKELVKALDPPLIEGYFDFDKQLQQIGFDLSLSKILTPKKMEAVVFKDAKKIWLDGSVEHDLSTPTQQFRPYSLVTAETVHLPPTITGICFPRSSLTRLGGDVGSGLIDPGFNGSLTFSLQSLLSIQFEKGDRIAQVIFFEHEPTERYSGQYQNVVR